MEASSRFRWMLFGGYSAGGIGLLFAYFLVPAGLVQDAWYQVIGLVAIAAIVGGVRLHGPCRRWPWLLLGASLVAFSTGDAVFALQEQAAGGDIPFPSLADPVYLISYPLAAGALWGFIRSCGGANRATLLDASIITVVGGLLLWRFVVGLYFGDGNDSLAAQLTSAAYPIGDLLVLAFAVRLMISARTNPSLWLLMLGAALLLAADVVYARVELTSGYVPGALLDAGWLAQYLLFGAAALHPRMTDVGGGYSADAGGRGRLLMLGAVGLVSPLLMLVDQDPRRVDTIALSVANTLLVLLVVARMSDLISSLTRSLDERRTLSDELRHQANSDVLTGLPNRGLFANEVQRVLAERDAVVAFCDLDEFKMVNDGYGHGAGDELLMAVAARLREVLSDDRELVARLGGDEFGVLMGPGASPVSSGERLLAAFDRPFELSSGSVRVGASIGLTLAGAGSRYSVALADADVAMYTAKQRGKHQAAVFEPAQRELVLRDPELAIALAEAIERHELVVHYQPVVTVEDGTVIGLEAMVRWQRPGHGLLLPPDFVPIAEANGLILDIDAWVLRVATADLARWRSQFPNLRVAVNLSGLSIRKGGLSANVAAALEDARLASEALTLEITEQILIEDRAAARAELERLSAAGVTIALDDFGTGYSSLSYLQEFPVDVLKLDRSFVTSAGSDAEGSALLRAAIRLGQALGLQVIAEGVESEAQWSGLRSLGCEFAQGYLFSRPLSAAAIDELLAQRREGALHLPSSSVLDADLTSNLEAA